MQQLVFAKHGLTLSERVDDAIQLLRAHEPSEPYYGCFSGGKDSVVMSRIT